MSAKVPERVFGIYGFEFTKEFTAGGIRLVPLLKHPDSQEKARDSRQFHLTGYGSFASPLNDERDVDAAFLLAAAMTFAQQQEVLTSVLIDMSRGDTVDDLFGPSRMGEPLDPLRDRHTFGEAILADVWAPDSRATFIDSFRDRFRTEQPNDQLRTAFFRQIEIWRLATPFVELHHFLAFSGLELLARSQGPNIHSGNAAIPICDLLNAQGFPATQHEIEGWALARNAAFHRGLLVSNDPRGGPDLRLTDQLVPISRVLCDVLLKLLPFDDGRINWNRWRDRMGFR